MRRKDTIIIAVLINAGLLIVLFASALKSTPPQQEIAANPSSRVLEPVVKKEYLPSAVDEIDQALQKMTPIAAAPSLQPPAHNQTAVAPAINFTDDLKSFTVPDPSDTAVFSPPTATAFVEEKKSSEYTEIKVKKGDVLEKIARQHHSNVDAIIAYNQLSSTNLRIGQTIKIPKKGTPAPAVAVAHSAATSTDAHRYYVVKNGDNPWTIAVKNHMKVEELLKLNNLDQEKARKLKPGDKLIIQ